MGDKLSSGEAAILIALAAPQQNGQDRPAMRAQLGAHGLRIAAGLEGGEDNLRDKEIRKEVNQYRATALRIFGSNSAE